MRILDWLKSRQSVSAITPPGLVQAIEPDPRHSEAHRIADSLRDFPGDWAWDVKGYRLKHVPSGFRMWVANGQRHLAECTDGQDVQFNPVEQAIIWKAVQPWMDSFKVGFSGRLPRVRIHAERGLWWCVAEGHPWVGGGNSPAHAYKSWARAVSIQERKDTDPKHHLQVWSEAL